MGGRGRNHFLNIVEGMPRRRKRGAVRGQEVRRHSGALPADERPQHVPAEAELMHDPVAAHREPLLRQPRHALPGRRLPGGAVWVGENTT